MLRTSIMASATAALAACGPATEPQPTVNAAPIDDYAERIRALPEGQRDAVLMRAIRDAGRDCQHVAQSAAIGEVGGAPAWSARCDDNSTWVVALNPGGVATVTAAQAPGAQR